MKFVLTGATGFVGAFVARELLAQNHQVLAVYLPADATARLDQLAPGVTRLPIDLNSATDEQMDDMLTGADCCIHAAWYAVPGKYLTAHENLDCLAMSLRLIQAATRNNVRKFIGIGSCAEYDLSAGIITESTPVQPTTLYAACKASTGMIGQQLAAAAGMTFAWCRLFYLYGPFEPTRRLVPDLSISFLKKQPVPVTHGRQIRDFLHIADAAAAIVAVAISDVTGAVNIGSGTPVTVREVVEKLAALTGGHDLAQFGARAENLLDPPKVMADINKLKQHTTWTPRYSLDTGLQDCVAWWKEQHL